MEIKKYPAADVRRKSDIYFMIGLIVALGITLAAFNYKSSDEIDLTGFLPDAVEEVEEMTDITRQEQPPPPPPPPPQEIEVIEDDSEVEEEEFASTEVDQNTEIIVQEQVEIVEQTKEEEIFTVVEEQPEFPGGYEAMMKFLASNIQYPPMAKENNIQGRVVVQFVVEKDGRITDVKVVKDLGWGTGDEAARVVKMMPRWKPGKQRNKPVKVRFNLPVKFELN